ncbi:hypothetical protein SASPL_158103 [Salvia splendens]|uniref:Transcription initiation factor IIA subunit 2 n=1 Tax=Salvia splendens TaxID=180675 RepID=A0A8X8YUF6_SALSN|nr:hypothetical protein SASPL_158103 [Salvia splendens]
MVGAAGRNGAMGGRSIVGRRAMHGSGISRGKMATCELYRISTIGVCLTEILDQMVSSGVLSPELAIQSMTDALENEVKSKVSIKLLVVLATSSRCHAEDNVGHLHTYNFCDNVWNFTLQNAQMKPSNVSR